MRYGDQGWLLHATSERKSLQHRSGGGLKEEEEPRAQPDSLRSDGAAAGGRGPGLRGK